ncbi:hypothetical protein EDB89DRAFT_175553 [Lactarius sanguifluus]|nr:hypothetical protein EDB89DRAFT_175553 [Lactarius sanguifluus]
MQPTQEVPVLAEISYAEETYPYIWEQEDEFDVIVGDTFVVASQARGWWVVQRDHTGTGILDSDTSKQGWVPARCLFETRISIATAVAEASHANKSSSKFISPVSNTKTPILPFHIASRSTLGYVLMDYKKQGVEELDLFEDDVLRVFKCFNHRSYVRLSRWLSGKGSLIVPDPRMIVVGFRHGMSVGCLVQWDVRHTKYHRVKHERFRHQPRWAISCATCASVVRARNRILMSSGDWFYHALAICPSLPIVGVETTSCLLFVIRLRPCQWGRGFSVRRSSVHASRSAAQRPPPGERLKPDMIGQGPGHYLADIFLASATNLMIR